MGSGNLPPVGLDSKDGKNLLERFVTGNDALDQLERLLGQFNVFEAMGAQRQELRHSDFLAFLLNPRQPHGLRDTFMRLLLQRALSSVAREVPAIDLVDLDTWDFDETLVLREWADIDILLLDEAHRLAVIIENKIDTTEHDDQLCRYWQTVKRHYPGWRIVAMYLTPNGDAPSHQSYLPIDYGLVCAAIETIESTHASTLGPDVLMTLKHYTSMLRRDIMPESEIAELCRRIYQRHQRALDLIFEYRPDRQTTIFEMLMALIREYPNEVLSQPEESSKRYIRFIPCEWQGIEALSGARDWTPSGRALQFEFQNSGADLRLKLILGPAPSAVRQHYYDVACHNVPLKPLKHLTSTWTQLYSIGILTAQSLPGMNDEEVEARIRQVWSTFVAHDLPEITRIILANPYSATDADH